jgi:hypothetical protein
VLALVPYPVLRPTANPDAAGQTPVASRAAMVVVARARVRAAALRDDPLAVEAAGRAYVVAVNLALMANLAQVIGAILRAAWQSMRGQRARPASAVDLGP